MSTGSLLVSGGKSKTTPPPPGADRGCRFTFSRVGLQKSSYGTFRSIFYPKAYPNWLLTVLAEVCLGLPKWSIRQKLSAPLAEWWRAPPFECACARLRGAVPALARMPRFGLRALPRSFHLRRLRFTFLWVVQFLLMWE